jgi:hypothetical protein
MNNRRMVATVEHHKYFPRPLLRASAGLPGDRWPSVPESDASLARLRDRKCAVAQDWWTAEGGKPEGHLIGDLLLELFRGLVDLRLVEADCILERFDTAKKCCFELRRN